MKIKLLRHFTISISGVLIHINVKFSIQLLDATTAPFHLPHRTEVKEYCCGEGLLQSLPIRLTCWLKWALFLPKCPPYKFPQHMNQYPINILWSVIWSRKCVWARVGVTLTNLFD